MTKLRPNNDVCSGYGEWRDCSSNGHSEVAPLACVYTINNSKSAGGKWRTPAMGPHSLRQGFDLFKLINFQ